MTRVLVTGASGFAGSHLLRHLLTATDWDVTAVCSFRHRGTTDRVARQMRGIPPGRVRILVHDLRAPVTAGLSAAIGPVDYVLDLASESSVDRSISEPREFCENNLAATLTMLEWARGQPPVKFIHVSTDEVYGPAPGGHQHAEGEPHRPSNPYAASKAAQEDLCYAWWRTYGLPVAVTNTMNMIGEMQDPEKFVPMVTRKVLAGETVTVHAAPGGSPVGSRHYLHARNHADALVHLLTSVPFPAFGEGEMGRWNIAGEQEISNLDLAQMIAGSAGRPLHYRLADFHSSRPGHDLRYALDGSKIAATGWKAPLGLAESLERTVRWSVDHPVWLGL